jgi:predicted transcriptional regulator
MADVTSDRDVVPLRRAAPDAAPLFREVAGAVLRDARRRLGLRLVDVARRAGVSPQYLSEIERGVKDPSS